MNYHDQDKKIEELRKINNQQEDELYKLRDENSKLKNRVSSLQSTVSSLNSKLSSIEHSADDDFQSGQKCSGKKLSDSSGKSDTNH